MKFKPIWLVAPAIVVVWLMGMYYYREVFPFGTGSILGYDLYNGSVPVWYHIYDAWHSGDLSALFYDFTTAGGFVWNWLLSILQPRNLFLLLWPREYFADAVSVFFVFEMALIALSASFSFSKIFPKLADSWLVLISLMYTFSGYNLVLFTNMDWLDTVLLYPLLIVSTLNLFKNKSKIPFLVILSYLFLFGTYMAFFVMVSLIIFGGFYIFLIEKKSNRKNAILSLGIGAGVSLVAGARTVYNFASSIFGSARMDTGSFSYDSVTGKAETVGGYWGILNTENQIDIAAVFMFMGMALAIASLIVLWVHFKKHKESRKYILFFTIVVFLLMLQIVVKSVMLLWHGGSFQMFPFRNGYMVAFFCCCIIGYYYSEFEDKEGVDLKGSVLNFITIIPAFVAGLIAVCYVGVYYEMLRDTFDILNLSINFQTNTMRYPYMCLSLALIACLLLIKLIKIKNVRRTLSMAIVVAMIGVNSLALIGYRTAFQDSTTYEKEKRVIENVAVRDVLCRVNNDDGSLMTNYGYVAGVSTLANWTHSLSSGHLKAFTDLGFETYFTSVTGIGGTVFSEALMRVTHTTSEMKMNNQLYEKYAEDETGIDFYKNRYTLPVGLVFDEEIKAVNADDFQNTFEYQNAIYKSIAQDGELFEKVSYADVSERIKTQEFYFNADKEDGSGKELRHEEKEVCTATYTIDIGAKSVLYFAGGEKNQKPDFTELKINGKKFKDFCDGTFSNAPIELGVYENETVKIAVKFSPDAKATDSIVFYSMDLGKLETLCSLYKDKQYKIEETTISFETEGEKGQLAFVPISYDENWVCTVNGEKTEPICLVGNFIGVELAQGANQIVMEYSTTSLWVTTIEIFAAFFLGLGLVVLIDKKIKIPKIIYTLAFIAFVIIFVGGMVVLYALPVGWSVIKEIIALTL